jgi:hypothetical protein
MYYFVYFSENDSIGVCGIGTRRNLDLVANLSQPWCHSRAHQDKGNNNKWMRILQSAFVSVSQVSESSEVNARSIVCETAFEGGVLLL